MEPISSLTLAWSLFGNITLGVGVNELHRQMVNRLGNRDIASLSLQKALHRSLLDAVDTLARSFADPAHPTFRAIPDPATRREEQERIKNLMQRIRARFPETGSLHRPVDLLLHDAPHKDTRQRLRELGLEADLAELPPAMYDSFHANLSLLMLAHFRHKLATDSGLGTLLQLDMTVGVGRELAALSAFLQERFGSDLPEQIRPLFDDLTSDLKAYLAQELADLRQELREVKSLLQLPDSDIFCVLTSESGSRHVERYLAHKAGGRLYLEPQTVEAFTEKIGRNGSLLIRGLPGTGKTLTGLALAESLRYRQQPYTIFYINLRYRLEENDLIEGVKRRLTQPALFFFDDCQGQYDLADNLRRRLKRVFRQSQVRGLLLFAARATPTPAGAPRGDESDFEADLTENEAVLEFHPTLQFFRHVITLIKPHFAGLSKERLTRVFEFTGRDLFLLDQLMDVLERPVDIDQLTPATLYAKTMQRYFGSSTVYRPAFLKLAALAQFDLAPPAPFLERDLSHEDVQAAEELVVLAGRPPCYYFLHASAAELIFRALVWNAGQEAETVAIAGDHLLAYFRDERLDDRQRTAALLNVMQNRLRLQQSESEEPAIKSRFLANGEVLAFIERAFAGLPLNTIAAGLSILREQNDNAFVPYYALLRRQVETGLVLRQTLQQPFGQTGFFLRQAKAHYPELIASLRRQMRPGDLPSLLSKTGLQNFLLLLSNLAQTDDPWWQETLAALNEQMLDRLIDQTLAASHPIGTLALRQLAQTDPDLLRALEAKIGAPRYLRLITSAGTVVELFKIIEHSSPAMRAGLIAALDDRLLDRLLEQTLASGRSIGTLDLALRELGRTDPALRRALEAKIGAPRYLRLITSAGTVYELFMIIQHSSPAMRAGLIAALDDQTLDRLLDQTLASGRSIGTLHLALRALGQTDPNLLHALEAKIGAQRYLRLITSAGTVYELFMIIQHSSPAMRAGLIAALDDQTLDRLLDQTLASGRSIGTLHLALRELGQTDPALRRALEAKIGAPRYLRLIAEAGTIFELFMIIQHSSPAMRAGLIAALNDQTLDRLLDQTLASGRSIGTLHLALRALGQTDPALRHALEAKIGAQRYLRLITSAGTVFELFKIIEHSSPAMRTGLIAALDDQTLDRLLDQTLASGRSIGTLHLALRELGRTDPALLRTLEAKIGAHRWWRLILALGRIRVLTHILECMSWQFRQDMVQAGSNFSAPEWQLFLSRSNFLSICGFVRWYANFADVLFTPAFCQAHQPTFETLISQASHEALIRGARILKSAPDSAGKQYLVQRLVSHLASLELSAPTFETFNEAANTIGLLWEYLPAQRARLVRSLLSHLPPEDRWAEDEQFVRAVRVLFHILADPAAPQDIARRLLRAGNGPTVAALLAQATTLDIFLYLWNLYVLWYQLHSQADQAFAAFLDATIQDTVAKEAASRFGLDDQDIDVHIMLIGFLHFIGLAPDSIDKHHWQGTLPPPGELIKRVSQKPFIPAVFFLLGLEWLYEQPIRYYVWEWIVPKAEAYGERTAALDHINQLAMSRTKG